MSPETWGHSSNIIGDIMSKYTKVFFSVAVVCQIILLAVLNDSKVTNNTYNIEFSTLFTIITCSVASMLYIFVGFASYNQDKQFANIK